MGGFSPKMGNMLDFGFTLFRSRLAGATLDVVQPGACCVERLMCQFLVRCGLNPSSMALQTSTI